MIIVVCTGTLGGEGTRTTTGCESDQTLEVGPNIYKIMNEICFGTATTQSRIPSEIFGVSDSSYMP